MKFKITFITLFLCVITLSQAQEAIKPGKFGKGILNVILTIEKILQDSPVLAEMSTNGEIKIVGAMYNIKSGAVEFYD